MNVFDKLKAVLDKRNDILFEVVETLHSGMQQRIFQDGRDSEDRPLGKYSPRYARFRDSKGRQTENKDLNFYGDLERSFQVGKDNDDTVIGFSDNRFFLIAGYQETQISRKIFKPTKAELEETNNIFADRIINAINNA